MSSDWRALIHYVDEGGVTAHIEQNTKWDLNKFKGDVSYGGWGACRRVWGGNTLGSGYRFAHRLKARHRVA